MLDIENFDNKFKSIVQSLEWKQFQDVFNKSKDVFIFGHGGNMGVADHAAIDITRLTDKNVIAPGSGVLATSIISDESLETWLAKWLEYRSRGKNTHQGLPTPPNMAELQPPLSPLSPRTTLCAGVAGS